MPNKIIFLSIHPYYVNMIIQGRKVVDLRRVRPTVSDGDKVVIYSTHPTKAIQALSTVDGLSYLKIEKLWSEVGDRAGVTRSEFENYFDGTEKGAAIYLREVIVLSEQITLSKLRAIWPNFRPPQSYRYFSANDFNKLIQLLG